MVGYSRKLISSPLKMYRIRKGKGSPSNYHFPGVFAVEFLGVVFGLRIGNQKDCRDYDDETALRSLG